MFCAKKVTKLPDLTVGHIWFLNFEWIEKLLKDIFYKFLLEFISIVSKNVKPFYLQKQLRTYQKHTYKNLIITNA